MSKIIVVKDEAGRLAGLGDKGARAFDRFKRRIAGMDIGETMEFSWRNPRSPGFHKLFFVMLHALFKQQEQFADEGVLRDWLSVGAGHCMFAPGPTGRMVAIPRSIDYASLDDDEFRAYVSAVWAFMRTEHAQRFLWPMASPAVAADGVEALLIGFDA